MAKPKLKIYGAESGGFFFTCGEVAYFFLHLLAACRTAYRSVPAIVEQIAELGVRTLPIGSVMAVFVGMVISLQTGIILLRYGAEASLGTIVSLSLVKELAPVMTGILVAGLGGSAMAAQLGTMTVSEEIDAMRTMGINPIQFLAMPRFLATAISMPLLVVYTIMIGLLGGSVIAASYLNIPNHTYFRSCFDALDMMEVLKGLCKATVFGIIVATIGCYYGFRTRGGAAGVGRNTTRSVVVSFMLILIANYFLTRIML